jgi:endogenous inhibitor of DNA gyrase (YacG/DUF329 family)
MESNLTQQSAELIATPVQFQPKAADEDERRLYCCKRCKAVLGIMVKRDHRWKLDVLRDNVSAKALKTCLPITGYSVRGLEHGDEVICGRCGEKRTWNMSEAALDDLLSRRRRRTFGLTGEKESGVK